MSFSLPYSLSKCKLRLATLKKESGAEHGDIIVAMMRASFILRVSWLLFVLSYEDKLSHCLFRRQCSSRSSKFLKVRVSFLVIPSVNNK